MTLRKLKHVNPNKMAAVVIITKEICRGLAKLPYVDLILQGEIFLENIFKYPMPKPIT